VPVILIQTGTARCTLICWLKKQLPDGSNNWNGSGTFYFLNHYTSLLKTPAKVAISSGSSPTNTYVNNKKTCYRGKIYK